MTIKCLLGINLIGLSMSVFSNINAQLRRDPRGMIYECLLFIWMVATVGCLAGTCEHVPSYYTSRRMFNEDCVPANGFYFCFLIMCFFWIARPISNLLLIYGPSAGAKTLRVQQQFSNMTSQVPVIF